MDGGDPESDEGVRSVEEYDEDPYQVGGEAAYVRIFLQGHRSVGAVLQCKDVGCCPPDGTGPGGFPVSGGAATGGAAPTKAGR